MYKTFLTVAVLLLCTFQVQAGLKFDGLAMIERAPLDFAGDLGEAAGVVTDGAAMIKEIEQTGQRVKTLYEKGKMLKEKISDTIDSVKVMYDEVAGKVESFEEQFSQAQEQLDKLPTSLNIKGEEAEFAMQSRKDALYEEAMGKKQAAEENLAVLEALFEQAEDSETKSTIINEITALENEMAEYEEQIADLESKNSKILASDVTYQAANKLKEEAKKQLGNVLDAAKSKFGNLSLSDIQGMKSMSPEAKTAEYNKIIKDNFLLVDEPENAQNVTRVKNKRTEDLVDAIAKAFVAGAKFKNAYIQKQDDSDRIETNVMGADQQLSSIGMMIEQMIQEIRLLQDYNKLVLVNMRLKTAKDMLTQDYRLKNYDKDPASLNLDNYVFTEKDITTDEGKKSFLNNIRAK
ncbi:MAG: hypothetical protein IJF12_01790 [Alphaproteobacteria bacterium]|nr:hypothetical protein [Alphaproteobacteria bacterium]